MLDAEHLVLARRLARRYHCPGHTREDLEQEAVLVLLQALPLHDAARHGPLAGYLNVCVRSHLSRLVRADLAERSRHEPFGDDFLDGTPGHEPDPAQAAEVAEALELARRDPALARLLSGLEVPGSAERQRRSRATRRLRREVS